MLEMIFQRQIAQIIKVTRAHLHDPSDAAMTSRTWEFVFSDFDGWTILHLSTRGRRGGYWLYPMLLPESDVTTLEEQLPDFNINPSSAAYGHVMSGDDHWIEPYWDEGTDFNQAQVQLYFDRTHYGHPRGKENYVEFNQLVTHPLGLHWSPRKNSYCSVDSQGEEVEKIKVIETEDLELIIIRRRTLDKLLHLGKWVLLRYLDFNRWRSEHPSFGAAKSELYEPAEYDGKFEVRTIGSPELEYIEFRGAQIERPKTKKKDLLSWRSDDEEENEEKYASFIVEDWKNGRLLQDYSLDPKNFANYFTESPLPFEMSTLYFKPEVLDKYKNNPDKFGLEERSINCRGGWNLQTFDVNEYRQVHTYAIYLSRLPYKEQIHWAQYNEPPKGPISKRAIDTDFNAKWTDSQPKLDQLRDALLTLSKIRFANDIDPIWIPKGGSWETASKGLYYLHTENPNEWHDFVIALANASNEGFQGRPLRSIATKLNLSTDGPDKRPLGTLGLLKAIISNLAMCSVESTHGILNDLQKKRGMGKAHGTWEVPEGSLVEDADRRLSDVTNAIRQISELLKRATTNKQGASS